jgi:hypothetical protein
MEPLESQQGALGGARMAAYAVVVGSTMALGAGVGGKVGGVAAQAVLTASLGAAGAAACATADKKRVSAAPKALWNGMQGRDPLTITKADVDAIGGGWMPLFIHVTLRSHHTVHC